METTTITSTVTFTDDHVAEVQVVGHNLPEDLVLAVAQHALAVATGESLEDNTWGSPEISLGPGTSNNVSFLQNVDGTVERAGYVRTDRRLTVCTCCALWLANNDDSGCRDYYGHEHNQCDLGLEQGETAVVEQADDSGYVQGFRCAGCGDDYVDTVHYVDVLVARY